MRNINIYFTVAVFALVLFFSSNQLFAEDEKPVSTDKYTFNVLNSWKRAVSSEERQVKRIMTKALQGVADANNFLVFQSPKGYMIVVYDLTFRQSKPTLEEGMNANKMNFKMGKERGIVKTVISNQIIEIAG